MGKISFKGVFFLGVFGVLLTIFTYLAFAAGEAGEEDRRVGPLAGGKLNEESPSRRASILKTQKSPRSGRRVRFGKDQTREYEKDDSDTEEEEEFEAPAPLNLGPVEEQQTAMSLAPAALAQEPEERDKPTEDAAVVASAADGIDVSNEEESDGSDAPAALAQEPEERDKPTEDAAVVASAAGGDEMPGEERDRSEALPPPYVAPPAAPAPSPFTQRSPLLPRQNTQSRLPVPFHAATLKRGAPHSTLPTMTRKGRKLPTPPSTPPSGRRGGLKVSEI